jgi:uncharacterized RDD family membrane protein YckC
VNKASLKKRIFAYLIDISVVILLSFIVASFLPTNPKEEKLNNELQNIGEMYINKQISADLYFRSASKIFQDLDKQRINYNVCNLFIILFYFVFVPYVYKGQTLGKKYLKIKTVRKDKDNLTINNLLIKTIINNGLIYTAFSLALLFLVPSLAYFITTSVLGIMQIVIVIISIFMIKCRKDKRGIQDILSLTKEVEIDNNERI